MIFLVFREMVSKTLSKKIGSDTKTLFWHESWLGGEVVKKHFSRLFNLATEKDIFNEGYDVRYWC